MEDTKHMEPLSAGIAYLAIKLPVILAAGVMALLGFMLDSRRHSWPTAVLAVLAGICIAVLMTDPLGDYFHLGDAWRNAIAGILGISGRNLIMTISKVSRDPALLIRIWRGERDDDPDTKA